MKSISNWVTNSLRCRFFGSRRGLGKIKCFVTRGKTLALREVFAWWTGGMEDTM